MPELPDVVVYVESLEQRFLNKTLNRIILKSPFLLRTFEPDVHSAEGRRIVKFERLGKRIVWHLEDDLLLVFHLMIAGRYHLRKLNVQPKGKNDLCAFCFDDCVLMLTEASKKKRASLHIEQGVAGLEKHDPGGLEVLECKLEEFRKQLLSRNHTLKRALTSPRLFSGIGNAYSDEILHAAKLSPLKQTQKLKDDEVDRLYESVRSVLDEWTNRHREKAKTGFPEKVTAFHHEMVAHGKFGHPCPVCNSTIQRIVYADNETNYCPTCQNDGKLYSDRSLSRLLKSDWPKTAEEWEQLNS